MSLNTKHSILSIMAAAIALVAISSCNEDSLNIGQSLTDEGDKVSASTTTFNVSTRTIMADSVLALAADCYLGRVKDPQTGADVTSEFTTQFHLLETTYLAPEANVLSSYEGRPAADSCDIILYLDAPARQDDSLQAMKMVACELGTPLEEGQRYYSNFNPVSQGLLRADGIRQPHVFSYADLGETDSARTSSGYQPAIRIPLNAPYKATDGALYNNYGTYIMRQYYDHPERFRNSYTFTHQVCPGFLFQIADGLGFHSKVTNIGLRIFYTAQNDTAIINPRLVLAGTREVLQTTQVINDEAALQQMAAETEHTYLKTPSGLFTEVTMPVIDIMQGHERDSLLAAKLTFQRLNSQSTDSRLLSVPQALLLVQKDSLKSFFENNRVPDNITAYLTAYSSTDNTYTFNNLSSLITTLWQMRQQHLSTDNTWADPNSDRYKMVLVPVSYSTSSSSSTITGIHHTMALTSTRLVGGPNNPNEPLRISIVYANFQ